MSPLGWKTSGLLLALLLCMIACQTPTERKGKYIKAVRVNDRNGYDLSNLPDYKDIAVIKTLLDKGNKWASILPDSAIPYYLKILSLTEFTDYAEMKLAAYNNLYYCYSKKKEENKAAYYKDLYNKTLRYVPSPYFDDKNKWHQHLMIKINIAIAGAYFDSGNYDSASVIYAQVIQSSLPVDSIKYEELASAYQGLGSVSARLSDKKKALYYFNKAEVLARQHKDTLLYINILSNKASLFLDQKEYATSRNLALEGLRLGKEINVADANVINLNNTIAISFLKEQQPELAFPYSRAVFQTAQQTSAKDQLINGHALVGYNLVSFGKYNEAEILLLKGLELAKSEGNVDNIANLYGQLAVAYEGMGAYRKALNYQKMYMGIRDSLLGTESVGRIAEIETRYRVARKDVELAQKDKSLLESKLKLSSQRKQQYLGIVIGLICIIFLLGLLLRKRYQAQIVQLKATLDGEEKERRRLSRELHDGIVSYLSVIQMNLSALPERYPVLKGAEDFCDILKQLEQGIDELRDTSHNLLPDMLQSVGLKESIEVYCEKVSKISNLAIDFQWIGESLNLSDEFQLNAYRIIQELIQNIIKHSGASQVFLQFNTFHEMLTITIEDNGKGMVDSLDTQGRGIGLQNLKDRIQLLQGTMEVEKHQQGTTVYLEFEHKWIRQ